MYMFTYKLPEIRMYKNELYDEIYGWLTKWSTQSILLDRIQVLLIGECFVTTEWDDIPEEYTTKSTLVGLVRYNVRNDTKKYILELARLF